MHRTTILAVAAALLLAAPAVAQINVPDTPPYVNVRAPFQPLATVYAEDFETSDGGFVASGNASWQWGEPSVHVQPATGQGPGMWATNLHGSYNDHACGFVESPAIPLSGAALPETGVSAARIVFRHWMQAENLWDGGVLQASADGVTWRVLTPVGGYDDRMISSVVRACLGVALGERVFTGPSGTALPDAAKWDEAEFDVSAFLGGDVRFRWVFAADTSAVRLGWYVDDVLVQVGAGAARRVDIPSVDPSAGVPFTPAVTLYAEDFEATDGDWTASGTAAWGWGEALAPPLPPTGSLNLWGTTLSGDYAPSQCGHLTSPPIALPGAAAVTEGEAARLTMQLWRHLRSGYDAANLQISTDGGASWEAVVPSTGYDRTTLSTAVSVRDCLGIGTSDRVWSGPSVAPKPEDWMDVVVDLTPYLGNTVQLRLAFASGDSGVVYRGVYMGDVIVQVGAGASVDAEDPPSPSALGVQPPGWTVVGEPASWEYGLPSSGPTSTRPVWATVLDGAYPANECSALVSDPIDTTRVAGLGRLALTLEHYFTSDSFDDGGVIQVSDDGGATWDLVTPFTGYPATLASDADACLGIASTARGFTGAVTGEEYDSIEVPLQSYQGKTIQVRFVWFSDASVVANGWYLRSIALTRGAAPLPLALSGHEGALSKIDSDVLSADGHVRAIVSGTPHDDVTGLVALDRAHAMATLTVLRADFLDGVAAAVEAAGGEVLGRYASAPAVAVIADAETLAILAAREDVVHIGADSDDSLRLVEPVAGTDEGDGVGAENTQGRRMIQAEEAWGAGFRGEGVKIAIIDTGIDPNHEAFKRADGTSRVEKWFDAVNDRTVPYDDQGHGTHVAGTAIGSDHYVDPVYGRYLEVGVAPEATVYVAKFLNSGGSGSYGDAILSLEWAYEQGADITSNSWGGGCSSSATGVMASVRTLTDAGMLSVFAAGNAGGTSTISSPGCSESSLTVGAVGANGVIASFSSRGPCTDIEIGGSPRICPDVVAKGYLVNSAASRGSCSLCSATGYLVLNGTSMATPHVAGAVALAEQMKRAITGVGWDTAARAEEEVFKLTALDLGPAGPDNTYGWGLPQLMSIHAMLLNTDEASIVATFGISDTLLRQGETSQLTFGVRNLGGATATGSFVVTLTTPDGSVQTLRSSTPSLGLLASETFSEPFTVTNNVGFGSYTFRGVFDYSWTNSTSGETQTATIVRDGVIEVKRVQVQVTLDGLAAAALPGELQSVSYTAKNVGNEDATALVIEFTVPDDYVFVPGENFNAQDERTRYADPAPAKVVKNTNYGRITLIFEVGALPQDAEFSFTTQMLPTTPGAYRVTSVAKYFDGANNAFSQGAARTQQVGLSAP